MPPRAAAQKANMVSTRGAAPKPRTSAKKKVPSPVLPQVPSSSDFDIPLIQDTSAVQTPRPGKRLRSDRDATNEPSASAAVTNPNFTPNAKRPRTQKQGPRPTRRGKGQAASKDRDEATPSDARGQVTALLDGIDAHAGVNRGTVAVQTTNTANVHLRMSTLPILDNLATQILDLFSTSSTLQLLEIAGFIHTDAGQAYDSLLSLFKQTKRLYCGDELLLDPAKIGLTESTHVETIRKSNMATFATSILGGDLSRLRSLDDNFLHFLRTTESPFQPEAASIWIDLKTRACVMGAATNEVDGSVLIAERFPPDLEASLLHHNDPVFKGLDMVETGYLEKAQTRRNDLIQAWEEQGDFRTYSLKHPWSDTVNTLRSYIGNYHENTNGISNIKSRLPTAARSHPSSSQGHPPMTRTDHMAFQSDPRSLTELEGSGLSSKHDDIIDKATRAARLAIENYAHNLAPQTSTFTMLPGPPNENNVHIAQNALASRAPLQFHYEYPGPHAKQHRTPTSRQAYTSSSGVAQAASIDDERNSVPYPTQSAPTHVLYERARMAATSKTPAQPRKATTESATQRRPWTAAEENALMVGLDRVKGPHWSQIHSIFGPGGTINEVLKDRSQVQLKDKARNLKLFFLKANIEVPYYLQFVTGELRTRAPPRSSKPGRKEKGSSDDDRVHVQGIMALATGAVQDGDEQEVAASAEAINTAEMSQPETLNATNFPDINIDPSLGFDDGSFNPPHQAGDALQAGSGYPVPTPNMIMANLDRYSAPSGMTPSQQLQREQDQQR